MRIKNENFYYQEIRTRVLRLGCQSVDSESKKDEHNSMYPSFYFIPYQMGAS